MRLPVIALLGAILIVIGWGLASGGGSMTKTRVIDMLQAEVKRQPALGFKAIDCKKVDQVDFGGQSLCYGSNQDETAIIEHLGSAIQKFGYTPGWREDYTVWAAFYEMRDGSKRTFGISIAPVKGNRDLETVKEVRPYKNLITLTVDKPE